MPGQQSDTPPKPTHDARKAAHERIRTKEVFGSLDLLHVGHFDGEKPKGGRELSGGGRTSWKRKSVACERLSTFSDSAGISTPSPTDKAARQKFAGPITFRPSLRAMLAASRRPAIIARRTASTLLRQALSSHTTSHLFQSRHPWRTHCIFR